MGATRFATSAAAIKPASGGIFSWLTGESSSTLPPLETQLPGVNLPPALPDHVQPSKTQITTLSNGVKIASETSPVCKSRYDVAVLCFNVPPPLFTVQSCRLICFFLS